MAWIGVYLWALLGVLAAYDSLRRLLGLRAAVLGTVAAWLGTSAFAYTWKSPGMAHSITLATISLSFWCAVRARGSRHPQAWALLWGLFASLTVCARVIDGLILVPSFLLLLLSLQSPDEQQSPPRASPTRRILTSSVCALAGFIPLTFFQMSIWHALYGQWFFNGYAGTGYRFSPDLHQLGLFLLSPNKGVILWHPVILLALAGLGLAAISRERDRNIRLPSALSIAIVIVLIALYGSWSVWNLGDGYGARWTADLFWIWAFGLALLFARTERTLSPTVITAVLFALVSTGLIGAQIIGRIPLH
jgi:FtsH-binding integral membrane protein